MATKKKKKNGLPKKYAKMGFVKGWPAYNKAKKAAAAKRKKSLKKKAAPKKKATKKKATKKKTTKKKTAKKKTTTKKVTPKKSKKAAPKKKTAKKKGKVKAMAKKTVQLLSPKVVNAMISGGSATTGLILGTGAVNYLPVIKDQKAWIKAVVQALLGIGGFVLVKGKYWKMGFVGTTIGSLYTAVAPYLPQQFKLAGRDFTNAELQELMTLGIIDESTDISNMVSEDEGFGVVDEESDMPMMGKGRYHTAIDVY